MTTSAQIRVFEASCVGCSVLEGASWCKESLQCFYVDNITDAAVDAVATSASVCARYCTESCHSHDISLCFPSQSTVTTCGDCLFAGGVWVPSSRICRFDPVSHGACDEERSDCVTVYSRCPSCERFPRPLHCSATNIASLVVSGAAVLGLILVQISFACHRYRRK